MKILLINPEAELGGAERCLRDLAVGLKNRPPFDITPHALLLSEGTLSATLRANNIETTVLPLPPFWGRLGESQDSSHLKSWAQFPWQLLVLSAWLLGLRSKIKEIAPDLIHSHGIKTHLLLGLLRVHVPIVWHIHDFLEARRLTRPALRFFSRRVTLAIANSDATLEKAQTTLACPLRRIHNGVEIPAKIQRSLKDHKINVGLVATFARWKGHQLFFEAIALLKERKGTSRFRFCVVGSAIYRASGSQWDEASLQEEIRSLGVQDEIELLPFESNLDKLYARLDIVVNASTQPEPFGRTLVEAMARAKGVILSNQGGAVEIARHEQEGLHFINNDAVSLADAIERLGNEEALRKRLAKAALARVTEHFEVTLWVNEIVRTYGVLLAQSGNSETHETLNSVVVASGFPEDRWHSMRNIALNLFSELESHVSGRWRPLFFGPSLGRTPRLWDRRLSYPLRLPKADALLLLDHSYADCLVGASGRYQKTAVVINDFHFWHTRNWKNLVARRRILKGIRSATYRVTISEFTKQEALKLGIAIDRVIIPGARPDPTFVPLYIERIPGCLVHVGGTGPRKGIEKLLRLLIRLPKNFFLVQVGNDFSAGQKAFIAKHKLADRISTTGEVSNLEIGQWYHRAHAVLIPSTYEGFGLPAIEARLRDTTVVIDKSLPAYQSLKKDKGTLVLPFHLFSSQENAKDRAIADEIAMKILSLPCQSIPFLHKEEFAWSRVGSEYKELINELFKTEVKRESPQRIRRR